MLHFRYFLWIMTANTGNLNPMRQASLQKNNCIENFLSKSEEHLHSTFKLNYRM
jgi:hypothetical protein